MEIEIKNFTTHTPRDPSKPGAKKGTFGFTFKTLDDSTGENILIEINQCQYFDNGKSKWISYPEKRRPDVNQPGRWEHEFFYAGILEPNDKAKAAILAALQEYLAHQ